MVELYSAGRVTIQDVEDAEKRLLDGRHRLGEIDGPTWHRARAVLLAREMHRLRAVLVAREVDHMQRMVDVGRLSRLDLDRVRLSLELEKLLAGDANSYTASRDAIFAALKERQAVMVEVGRETSEGVQAERKRLEAEFPPADVAKAQDR
jgi:hypothetical protein